MNVASRRCIALRCKPLPTIRATTKSIQCRRNHTLRAARHILDWEKPQDKQWAAPEKKPARGPRRRQVPEHAEILPQFVDPDTGRAVNIAWHDNGIIFTDGVSGDGYYFHPTQIRDSCTCSKCRDSSSGQKLFASTEIPTGIRIKNVISDPEKGLVVRLKRDLVTTSRDSHLVTLSVDWIKGLLRRQTDDGSSERLTARRQYGVEHWDAEKFAARAYNIDYEEYMQEDSTAFWDAMRDLVRWGIVFLKNVPTEEDSIVKITNRIANIRETFYGRTFDVRAKPDAENVAYTSGYLGLHQDLLYLDPPPQIQVLHCMENSCGGGESLFSDGDRVARMMWNLREQIPIHHLTTINVPYAYNRNGHRYARQRPVLTPDIPGGNYFGTFFWSPPFQGEFSKPFDMYRWIKGARVFEDMVNAKEAVYETKMDPGDAVLFDNMRILHGRTAFDVGGGGSRWLRGAYIDAQDFFSTAARAPATHAVPIGVKDDLWSEEVHMVELAASPWHKDLLNRLRVAQGEIQEEQIDPAQRGQQKQREEQYGSWMSSFGNRKVM